MKIGIIGLPQVGKKTLFALLTGDDVGQESFSGKSEVKIGCAKIRDSRFDGLVKIYQPKKFVPATLDIVLLPKFDKESVQSGEFVKSLENCDTLCHMVRVFKDDAVFHVEGSVDPMRDISNIFAELILSDLMLIEKRLERISKELMNKSTSQQVKEKEILERMKGLLDNNHTLSSLSLDDNEKKIMSTYKFLTQKPMIIVLNVSDDGITDKMLANQIKEKFRDYRIKVMQTSAKIEVELSSLEEKERDEFLKDLNIKESALNQLTRLCNESLGYISFFTVGPNEVHSWSVRQGSSAPEAAGAIHSDMQRGFIRAEIMKSHELIDAGSESKLKEENKVDLKGKDYILEDGDVMLVRFNV